MQAQENRKKQMAPHAIVKKMGMAEAAAQAAGEAGQALAAAQVLMRHPVPHHPAMAAVTMMAA